MAEGDGLPIRAQRLTGPNPAQILRHLAQAERVEELGAVQLAWAATGRRRAGRRYSPQFAAPHPAHDVCGGWGPPDNQNIAIHLLLLSACPADHLGPTVKSRKGWPLQAP